MKKNIGNALALYPTPLVVVGAMVNGKPNWLLVGHLGIMGHDHVMVSLAKAHYTNQGIRATGKLSINIVDEALLPKADRAGCVSGHKEDKSGLFRWEMSENGVPMIADAPVVMVCTAADFYGTPGFDNVICTIDATYADEALAPEAARYGHSTFRQTAALAARAGARRLWLAHYSPRIEDPEAALPLAQAVFPAAECGFDGKSVTLPFTES